MWKSFDHSIESYLKTYDNIRMIAANVADDYTAGCLLDYHYFKNYYKLIEIDWSKQQKLDADPMQQISFTGDLSEAERPTMSFVIEEVKETVWNLSKGEGSIIFFVIEEAVYYKIIYYKIILKYFQ